MSDKRTCGRCKWLALDDQWSGPNTTPFSIGWFRCAAPVPQWVIRHLDPEMRLGTADRLYHIPPEYSYDLESADDCETFAPREVTP